MPTHADEFTCTSCLWSNTAAGARPGPDERVDQPVRTNVVVDGQYPNHTVLSPA
jgi:hypothetical protein